jgi:hypothetical protein
MMNNFDTSKVLGEKETTAVSMSEVLFYQSNKVKKKSIFSAPAWPKLAISVIGGRWPETHNPTHQKLPP